MPKLKRERESIRDKIYNYIVCFSDENGFPPSVRQIAEYFGIKSTSTVAYHLDKLKEAGKISNVPNQKRALAVSNKQSATSVPLVGDVSAGQGILAYQNIEGRYPLPQEFFGADDLFMLRVCGNSMIKVGILDGDYVVVRRTPNADIGEIAVAMWDEVASVKRIVAKQPNLVLHPENDEMEDIIVTPDSNPSILGKVVGVIRRM